MCRLLFRTLFARNIDSHLSKKFYTILIAAFLTSCLLLDEETKLVESPTGNYFIKATVNRTDKSKEDYAYVIIHVYDEEEKLFDFNSRAGDAQKWALGWITKGDTIVLQTSDIGDRAWIIDTSGPVEIEMTNELHLRAKELNAEKYK